MKFYTHKTTSIFVIDTKFHENPLFRLRDFQFFQTVVTNLRQQLLPAICSVWWLLHLPAGQCPSPPTMPVRRMRYCQLRHLTSTAHWIGHRTVQISIWGILQKWVYRSQISDVDHLKERVIEEWRCFDQNRTLTEQWISGVIDCINVYARNEDTSNIWFEHVDCSDWHQLHWKLTTCG